MGRSVLTYKTTDKRLVEQMRADRKVVFVNLAMWLRSENMPIIIEAMSAVRHVLAKPTGKYKIMPVKAANVEHMLEHRTKPRYVVNASGADAAVDRFTHLSYVGMQYERHPLRNPRKQMTETLFASPAALRRAGISNVKDALGLPTLQLPSKASANL